MPVSVHPLFGEGGSPPSSAMDLKLWDVGVDLAMQLNDTWHSLLPDTDKGNLVRNRHTAFYAAEYDGAYYAVAIWTDPVAGNRLTEPSIELRRLAICDEAPKNTATRMLGMMRKDLKKKFPHIRKAISYQAKKYHHGTIYKADNWKPVSETVGVEWKTKRRNRAPTQAADSAKVRWERYL